MPSGRKKKLSGREKAAIVIMALEKDLAGKVLTELKEMAGDDSEIIDYLTLEIMRNETVDPDLQKSVVEEFLNLLEAREFLLTGGVEKAKEILEAAFGPEIAKKIIDKLRDATKSVKDDIALILRSDTSQILTIIQNEHPQMIALILAHLSPEKAAEILKELEPSKQVEVTKRLAIMDRTSPEVINDLVERLRQMSDFTQADYTQIGGFQVAAELLNKVDRSVEKAIMEKLEQTDPEVADEIRKRMFVFEDIVYVDDRGMQRALREIKLEDLALALKGVEDQKVKDKFFNNMPKRMLKRLMEEIEYMGPTKVKDVQDAQQKIINIIRRLEEEGEIIISRGGGDVIV